MKTAIDHATKLVNAGFAVFPLQVDGKKPTIEAFTEQAATTPEQVKNMWFDPVMEVTQPYNIGIATSKYKNGSDHSALLVVDVDIKNEKNGVKSLNKLELEGKHFPDTLEQRTPTGGLHLIYKVNQPVPNSVDRIGVGLDIRSKGGFIVAAGSSIGGKEYVMEGKHGIAEAPKWLVDKCNEQIVKKRERKKKSRYKTDSKASIKRVEDYLKKAKAGIMGHGCDAYTFKVASRCKDLGVGEDKCLELMLDHWNERCAPPWPADKLKTKIENAFSYGQNEQGCDVAEADFDEVESPGEDEKTLGPIQKLNEEYSYVVVGGRSTILKRSASTSETLYLNVGTFHDLLKSEMIYTEGRWRQVSELWMESKKRSTYDRVELLPGKKAPKGVYNLWRGFDCEPVKEKKITSQMTDGVGAFTEHALDNICMGDQDLYDWLMSYFAHMIQKPWVKPSTALVFRGDKGVGKNALIDRVGHLFSSHYLITSNKRYLTSNFNNHLSRLLLFVLDEAFWSGDKAAEGVLKDLITGNQHLIEQKGREMYVAKNITRVCIIGNEEWLVPSSQDERRFAVFNVGSRRQQDTNFFKNMRKNLDKNGGNSLLLKILMERDISDYNPNIAPTTVGLLEQKIESLNPVHAWWHQCLTDGQISGLEFGDGCVWPDQPVARTRLRDAFALYSKERGIRSWLPSPIAFGKLLSKCCPGMENTRVGARMQRQWASVIPILPHARTQFSQFMRQPLKWPEEPDETLDESFLFS